MWLQRIFVAMYTFVVFLQTRVRHKKWIALVLVSLYIGIRSMGDTPAVGSSKKIFINKMNTETKDDGIHMTPTPVLAPWTNKTFECVGWKRIHSCIKEDESKETDETREPEKDFLGCTEEIGPQMAGYCIARNRSSGDLYKLMISSCDSLPNGHYTCEMAREFSEYGLHSVNYKHTPLAPSLALPSATLKRKPTNGVLMIVYDKVLPSAYATIRMLRVQGCELPVELWYRPDEMSIDNPIIHKLLADYNVRMRPIFDRRAMGFHVKPYAVYYSNFDNVLLLDADNLPAKDPTYLFEDPEFLRTGAIFWPDYWQPSNSLFQLTNTSLVWQLTGVKFADMFEQESGQVLINRLKSKKALDKLMFYSTRTPRLMEDLHLIWGDKDLFRLAWMNASQPYHFISFPPAVGGLDLQDKGVFCGLAMIQHDVQGNLVFFHRNSIKLDGNPDQPRIMTHIQEYALDGNPKDYRIFQAVYAHKECCYYIGTQTLADGRPATHLTHVDSTIYAAIEDLAIQFSVEAKMLLEEAESARGLTATRNGLSSTWQIQHIIAMFLLAYVTTIIGFVWCKASPGRERLPSRWKPMESKQS